VNIRAMLTEETVKSLSDEKRKCFNDDGSIDLSVGILRIGWRDTKDLQVRSWEIRPASIQRIMDKPVLERSMYPTMVQNLFKKVYNYLTQCEYDKIINSGEDIWFASQAIEDPTKISFFNKPLRAIQYSILYQTERQATVDGFRKQYAVMTRPGRFFKKFGIDDTSNLEKITGEFKDYEFKLVQGEDIRKYYLGDNYTKLESSTLHQSCMRGRDCQPYFDFYVEHLKMLVAFDSDHRIYGRALLWENVFLNGKSITFLDRIYGVNAFVAMAKEYAKKHGWYHKQEQNYTSQMQIVCPNGEERTENLVYFCSNNYGFYPYMDTFVYQNYGENLNNEDGERQLDDVAGNVENICRSCGSTIPEDEVYIGIAGDGTYCYDCWSEDYTVCEVCDETIYLDAAVCTDWGVFCPDCASTRVEICNKCGGYFDIGETVKYEGENYCLDCLDETEDTCSTCGTTSPVADLIENDGICNNCKEIEEKKSEKTA